MTIDIRCCNQCSYVSVQWSPYYGKDVLFCNKHGFKVEPSDYCSFGDNEIIYGIPTCETCDNCVIRISYYCKRISNFILEDFRVGKDDYCSSHKRRVEKGETKAVDNSKEN